MTFLNLSLAGARDELLGTESGASSMRSVATFGPYGVHDTLNSGMRSIAHDLAPRHPLQGHLQTVGEESMARRVTLGGQVLGGHVSFRLRMEEKIMGETGRRLSGLPASNLGMSIVNGTDDTIDNCDFLNVPSHMPSAFA